MVRSARGDLLGEIIRKTKAGRFIGFYLRWYEDGRRRQRASKQPTFAEARRMLQAIEGRIARGLAGLTEPPAPAQRLTVAALAERFLSEYSRPRVKDLGAYRRSARTALRRILPELGDLAADAVQPAEVARLRDRLGRRYAAASVKVSLAFLHTVFSWAVRQGLVAHNPCRGVERPRPPGLLEFLSQDDAARLLEHARVHAAALYPMIATALYTGLRKGELFGLSWTQLDLQGRRLAVTRSCRRAPKSGRPRHLRLPATLVPILAQWRQQCPATPEGLVFPIVRRGVVNMGQSKDMLDLGAILAAAGCPPLQRPWHALRHTFASHYVMAGGNILALQKILGHSDIKVTLSYAHLAPDYLGEEMERVHFQRR
jgi:integrase